MGVAARGGGGCVGGIAWWGGSRGGGQGEWARWRTKLVDGRVGVRGAAWEEGEWRRRVIGGGGGGGGRGGWVGGW